MIKTDLNIIIYKIPNFIRNDKILDKYFFTINNINKLNNLKYNNKMKISNYKNKFLPPKIKTNFLKKLINEKNYLFFAIPCLRGAKKLLLTFVMIYLNNI